MEPKKLTKNKSEKNLPKLIRKEKDKKEKEPGANFERSQKKSKTIIEKNLVIFANSYKYSEYLEQNSNFCDYMEDCALSINNFNKETYRHLFCIFDGHGGNLTAKMCVKQYPEIFKKCLLESPFDYEMALKKSFALMDKEIEKTNSKEVGNTATVVFINNKLLYCANVGDSSCCIIGKTNEFISKDDKCTNKKEIKRVEKAGGQIKDGRLGGILAVSRGLGDFDLKNKGLICEPHVIKKLIDHSMTHCVLASDGVWDVLNPNDVAQIIHDNNYNIDGVAKIIVETAMDKGSEDNISCIVIELNKKMK
jgi:serine/threonine protein phosphatase PrpC